MIISVSKRNIELGEYGFSSCPIALAMRRALCLEHSEQVEVGIDCVNVDTEFDGNYVQYDLPESAVVFIERFDMGKNVEPFDFELEIVQ